MSELTVILKDSDRTYRQMFLLYDPFSVCEDDPTIIACIAAAKQNFQGEPEEVQIKIHMEI